MKLFKLAFLVSLFAQAAMALNFSGVQSVVGLNSTRIFTASPAGIYYVQGYLNLPWGSNTGGTAYSQVVATVSKNGVTQLYQGAPGASGFSLPQITLSTGDSISVALSSTVTSDSVTGMGLNAITGQVYYGNAF